MPDWDQESEQLSSNLSQILKQLVDSAEHRAMPTVRMARLWHIAMMQGLEAPDPRYIGSFRGEKGLERVQVRIGHHYGAPAEQINQELDGFIKKLQQAITLLDDTVAPGYPPDTPELVADIIDLCAWVHAEWVRIHPFANGNGRIARFWANYIALRYGLPPFVTTRPRPNHGYATACEQGMSGDWTATATVFRSLYLFFLEDEK